MIDFVQRLKQRKLVQWAIAYVAGAWVTLQVLDLIAGEFGWPGAVMRSVTVVLGIGFFVALVLAWYHGERGAQRMGGIELVMLAALLVIAAVAVTWVRHSYGRDNAQAAATRAVAATGNVVSKTAVATSASSAHSAAPVIAAQPIPAKSVAVLPFENLSTDKGNAYFADGMQDLILTKLADIGDLKVISRASTMKYASRPDDLKIVGQQLGVATILEGSVQKAGNQVLINVQLIDARTDSHIWAQSYQRNLSNIFGVEGEVAEKVADALKAKLTPAESARVASVPTTNAAAYNAFLQGEYYVGQAYANFSKTDYHTAVDYYRAAVADDPEFALAWAQMATGQMLYIIFLGNDVPGLADQTKAAVDRALSLQPHLAQAHVAQGLYRLFVKHDITGASTAFATAHALKPQNWIPIFFGGLIQEYEHHPEAAIKAFRQASVINPRTAIPFDEMAGVYEAERRYREAQGILEHALAIDPSSLQVINDLAYAYVLTGNLDAVQALHDAVPASVKNSPVFMLLRARYFIYRRDWGAARTELLRAQAVVPKPEWDVECLLGDVERLADNPAKARPYYQRCAELLPAAIHQSTNGQVSPGNLGLALVHLGQTKEALAQGARGISESPSNAFAVWLMAQIQAQAGQTDGAIAKLQHLLSTSDTGRVISVPLLKLDPTWDPIRNDPRFQALLKKYGNSAPASAASVATLAGRAQRG